MATTETEVTDAEIESLMAELELESLQIVSESVAKKEEVYAKVKQDPPFDPDPPKAIEVEEQDVVKVLAEDKIEEIVEEEEVKRAPTEKTKVEDLKVTAALPAVPALVSSSDEEDEDDDDDMVKVVVPIKGLQHYVNVDTFRSDTRVTEATLDACMIEQNGYRAYYGTMAAQAEAQAARVKARFEVVEATLYDHHRKALALIGEKTTEKMVENAVKLDPRWLKAKNTVIEGETIAAINKALVESLKDRASMIIQLGADRRDEYKGATRVMEERNERNELVERARDSARRA